MSRKITDSLLFSVFIVLLAVGQAACQEVKSCGFFIPVMIENPQKGVFVELVKKTAEVAGLTISIDVLPTKRAIDTFLSGQYDLMFPGLNMQYHGQMERVKPSEELIYVKTDFAFVKKGNPMITSLDQLTGKKIGLTDGYPYSETIIFNNALKFEMALNDVINIKKLTSGRIDVFICEEKSGIGAIKQAETDQVDYDPKSPISKQDVYFAFQNTDKGKELEKKFSAALKKLKEDGTFAAIMAKAQN